MAHRKLTLTTPVSMTDAAGTTDYDTLKILSVEDVKDGKFIRATYQIYADASGTPVLRNGMYQADNIDPSGLYDSIVIGNTDSQAQDVILSGAAALENLGAGVITDIS